MNKIDEIRNLVEMFDKTTNIYSHLKKTTSCYGTDISLTPSEIQVIAKIYQYPKVNLTTLSEYLKLSKGTTTKYIQKLVIKNMVNKRFTNNSENVIEITLTDMGKIAAINHKEYVKYIENQLFNIYSDISEQTIDDLKKINVRTIEFFQNLIEEREK